MSMEEQHLAELEAIAAGLPADPFGMGQLRLLLGTLPNPTQPEVKSAREGAPDLAPGGPGIGQALSLTSSTLPGSESGAVIGAYPELFYGQSNLLENPAMDGCQTGVALGLVNTDIGPSWRGFHVVNSGSITSAFHDGIFARGVAGNPFASSWNDLDIRDNAGAAYSIDVIIEQGPVLAINQVPSSGHLVCSCRVWHSSNTISTTDFPAFYAQMEIVDVTAGTVVAESTPFDLRGAPVPDTTRITAAMDMADYNSGHTYRWRLRIHAEKTAGSTSNPYLTWGEPIAILASTQSAPPFMPNLGRWYPREFYYRAVGDSSDRLQIGGIGATGDESIRFGAGSAAVDARIRRTGTSQLTIDDAAGGAAQLIVSSIVSKPQLTVVTVSIDADQNNWNPAGFHTAGFLRVSGLTANRTITGLDAGTGGEFLVISNDSASSLILASDNASSSAANQFRFAAAANITIRTRGMVLLVYDNSRWRAIGA